MHLFAHAPDICLRIGIASFLEKKNRIYKHCSNLQTRKPQVLPILFVLYLPSYRQGKYPDKMMYNVAAKFDKQVRLKFYEFGESRPRSIDRATPSLCLRAKSRRNSRCCRSAVRYWLFAARLIISPGSACISTSDSRRHPRLCSNSETVNLA